MTPEQIAEIGVSGKGYWLFDRNSDIIKRGEAIAPKGKPMPMRFKDELRFYRVAGPWAIYKWIPYHRS
jgi:hypothetical protein